MRIRNLEDYNIPSCILDIWEKNYSPYLLPVQKKAVKDYDILNFNNSNKAKPNPTTYSTTLTIPHNNNHNLLVIAPPSSGKTLIGEMAAITHTIHQQKAIYLVPFPFMAEDKYNHFRKLYTSFGLDVVISSRTRKEDDQKIIKGDYDLAVIVYEKFNHFLLTYPDFLKKLSLLIIDKMQMINDYRKGPLLKSIIDIIRNRKPDLKIIALSAFTENLSSLKEILSARLLISFQRPVELRKGIVREGPRANQAIDESYQIEDAFSREKLLTLLEKGIAYYNSDLAWEEKDLIETYVKKGEIKVVCAATTLAMEINPTFKNVILALEKLCIEKECYQNNHQEPLSLIDIENIGGKAGILNKLIKDKNLRKVSKKEEFGRLIFLAHTNLQETKLKNLYFNLIADYHQQVEERFVKKCLMGKTVNSNYIGTNISEPHNPKPKTRNLQFAPRNLQPLLQIDSHRPDRIIFEGKEIKVTARGFSLLYLLAQHKGEVVSYDNILDTLWKEDEDAIYTRIIQHIYKFRRDILDAIGNNKINKEKVKDIFKVVSGRGVMLNINNKLKIN